MLPLLRALEEHNARLTMGIQNLRKRNAADQFDAGQPRRIRAIHCERRQVYGLDVGIHTILAVHEIVCIAIGYPHVVKELHAVAPSTDHYLGRIHPMRRERCFERRLQPMIASPCA